MAEVRVVDLPSISLEQFTGNDSFIIVDDGNTRRLTRDVLETWLVGNIQGERGEQGVAGRDGVRGVNGTNGTNGTNGLSAYQSAVLEGFVGSVQDWLLSLKGSEGADGDVGANGWTPLLQTETLAGSSYLKISGWVGGTGEKPTLLGYVGDSGIVDNIDFASNIRGSLGDRGLQGEEGAQGVKGDTGDIGFKGDRGYSAYEQAVQNGFVGTVDEWLLSLNASTISSEPNNTITKKIDGLYVPKVDPLAVSDAIDALPDKNIMTDAQKDKLEVLKTSKYLGTYLTSSEIPTLGAVAGNYADVDSGDESVDTERWIYDEQSTTFVKSVSLPVSETPESVKLKYESNLDTNAFTDEEKDKLSQLEVFAPENILYLYDDKVVTSSTQTFNKVDTGDYEILGAEILSTDTVTIRIPQDLDGNFTLSARTSITDGVISVKVYEREFDPVTGLFSANLVVPKDIPVDSSLEVKITKA